MKPALCLLLLALALVAQQQPSSSPQSSSRQTPASPPAPTKPEDLCTVEGQATSLATGEPVRKAEISLDRDQRSAQGTPDSYNAATDAGGNFIIKDVEPGKYRLSAQRTGFVHLQYGSRGPNHQGTTILLNPGQRLKDLSLRLSPQAVITGRILDQNNEPVASASVRTMRFMYMMGKRQLVPTAGAATNDLGEYRIYGLAEGHYYLAAREDRDRWESTVDASAAPTLEDYVTTYYPATVDPAAAALVELGAGVQLRGVNITLAKARTFHVRGRVEGRRDATIQFYPRGRRSWMSIDQQEHPVDQKGNFEIDRVLPGAYTLTAYAVSDRKAMTARREIDIASDNVDNIVLTVAGGVELKGRIDVESGTPPDLNAVNVWLHPQEVEQMFGPLNDLVHDGAFTIGQLAPDVYHMRVAGLPDGYWVKSVRMGDQEVKVDGIDLTRGPGDAVTIIIAPTAGRIEGAVIDGEQKPAPGAMVVLVPIPKLRAFGDAYRLTRSDEAGRFSLKNVEPGDYKLFAWEDVENGAYMDPDFLGPLEDRGQSISVQESGSETVQLTVIPASAGSAGRTQ